MSTVQRRLVNLISHSPVQTLSGLSCSFLFLFQKIEGAYGSFTLSCNYPKRDFSEEDMSKSLLDLELAPSAALIVLPVSPRDSQTWKGPFHELFHRNSNLKEIGISVILL